MQEILKRLGNFGIIPVLKIENASDMIPIGKALIDGGLPVVEITFRTEAAEEAIQRITSELPEVLVGAGTILSIEQAKKAIHAGAKFIVSPGLNSEVVKFCMDCNVAITPGCSSPTDIEKALGLGLEVVKFFPAEAFGGLKTLKALSAPYGNIMFIPTGGIDTKNLDEYLAFNKVLACGGSWMVKDELIKAGNFSEITKLTREAVRQMLGFDLAHIGINTLGAEDMIGVTNKISKIFKQPINEGNSSCFVGSKFEIIKGTGIGQKGHIAIRTNNIHRGIFYLECNGNEVDMTTAKESEAGSLTSVYLKEEIAGFALHLLQNK